MDDATPGPAVTAAQARAAVDAIATAGAVTAHARRRRLLSHLVDETLAARADRLKAFAIGIDVLDRTADFDPGADSSKRVAVNRLRQSLTHHRATAGAREPVAIAVPRGGRRAARLGGRDAPTAPARPELLRLCVVAEGDAAAGAAVIAVCDRLARHVLYAVAHDGAPPPHPPTKVFASCCAAVARSRRGWTSRRWPAPQTPRRPCARAPGRATRCWPPIKKRPSRATATAPALHTGWRLSFGAGD